MSSFSDYYENKIIDHMVRGEAFTPPSTLYIALFTANTGLEANSPSSEVSTSGTNYVRKTITLSPAVNGQTSNSADIDWSAATANWGTVISGAVVDHPTNVNWGVDVNVLMWGDLTTPKTIENEDVFKILATKFVLTVN